MEKQQVTDILDQLMKKYEKIDNAMIESYLHQMRIDVISALPSDDWISVEDRLPEDKKEVLCTDGEYIIVARFFKKEWEYNYCNIIGITHWMPLPLPPKN